MTVDERLQDIREHPEQHRHSWPALYDCCVIDGAVHMQIMDAHPRFEGADRYLGGRKCDVSTGPCSCGGWH